MVVRPKRAIKVYRVGDKVEVGRDRDVYGYSWFPATVARVVDDLSYVVEYFDLEEEGDAGSGKATEYLHWRFIRPAVEHMPRESEFRLGPGAAVEAYCDGAWSPGVVRRLVGDGEWEVSIVGKKAELLVTKVVELLKPQYKWNGKQWKIVTAKRRGNLRRRSMPGQNPSSPVEVISSADEYSHGPESSVTKKSRKKLQQLDAIVTEVSQMDTPLSALCKSPESNHSDSQVSEKNSLQPPSHGIVSSAPMNGLLCASSGRSTPQNESIANSTGETVDNQETLSEMMDSDGPLNTHAYGASAGDAHDMLSIAELRKKMVSAKTRKKVLSVKALEVKKGISKSKGGNTHPIQVLHGKNDASDNIQLNGTINFSKKDIVCALSAFGEGQTTKTPDREVPRRTNRGSSTKVLAYKKLAKRNVPRELCSPHSSLDVTSTVQQRGRKKVAGPMEESLLAEELDKTLEDSWNIADLTEQDLLPMVPPGFESMYDENGAHINGCLSEEEPNAMISEANINADVCTDHAATQVAKSNYPMKEAILSVDNQAQEGSRKVDERPILQCRQNAYSTQCPMDNASLRSCSASGISMPSPLPVSQVSGDVLFVKGSSMWALIEAMDVFKEVPQRPHFLSLRQLSPTLREGAALGLMVSFAELVKNTREASIDHSMEWFEDKMNTLCHLEANGFNVQFLQSTLTKLVHIKSDGTSYLGQIDKLKAQIVGKTASSSRMDAVLDEKDRGIAELEQKLGRLRQESQRIAQDKEHEEAELFRLQAARSRFEEAYGDTKRQFHNVLAELHRKRLT